MNHQNDSDLSKQAKELLNKYRSRPLIQEILRRLEADLPLTLTYHNLQHTLEVMYESLVLGLYDGLSERELELLQIAAAYHDAGFLVRVDDNEEIAAELAVSALRAEKSFLEEEIQIIRQMILDTQLVRDGPLYRQIPKIRLSRYLLDADLSNFGRNDFFEKTELIRRELGRDPILFQQITLQLIETHKWHTPAANALRQNQKLINIAEIRKSVARENRALKS
ncbi:MAG: HD domain-containing protein [Bdellovibrionales bacterium]|nr:HD domain-containing protein [Bdellovibrionales bacterium]